MPFVYMLRCSDGSLYTGATKDVAARLRMHAAGRASRYTRARRPVTLVWSCRRSSWGDALREEHRIKTLSRGAKLALIDARHSRGRPRRRAASAPPSRRTRSGARA